MKITIDLPDEIWEELAESIGSCDTWPERARDWTDEEKIGYKVAQCLRDLISQSAYESYVEEAHEKSRQGNARSPEVTEVRQRLWEAFSEFHLLNSKHDRPPDPRYQIAQEACARFDMAIGFDQSAGMPSSSFVKIEHSQDTVAPRDVANALNLA